MNFSSLILPKIVNHKRHELFEFRQMQHLLEILFYYVSDFESRKVQEKSGLGLFWRFRDAMAKTGQLLPLYNFASSETSPTVKHDI